MYKSFAVVRDISDEWLDLFKMRGEGVHLQCTLRTDGSVSLKVCRYMCPPQEEVCGFEREAGQEMCLFVCYSAGRRGFHAVQ